MDMTFTELLKEQQRQIERTFSQMDKVLARQGEFINIIKSLTIDNNKSREAEPEAGPEQDYDFGPWAKTDVVN